MSGDDPQGFPATSAFDQLNSLDGRSGGDREQIEIATPEQVDLRFSIAGIGSRFVAILLDQTLIAGFYLVLGLAAILFLSGTQGFAKLDRLGNWFVAGLMFIAFLVIWGYFALFEAYWHGQTPGKRAMKLRVIKDSGRQITLFESLARNLLRVVDYLPSLYLVGVITMLCNKRSKRLGDLVAGTLVVHERPEEQPLLFQSATTMLAPVSTAFQQPWNSMGRQGAPAMFAADAVAKLGAQDLVLIEAFFSRMLDLPMETRATMAYRICAQMAAKMGVPAPGGNPERALESMAYQMRGIGKRD
jgi:uncharacterized RDD family membrane protein YckC